MEIKQKILNALLFLEQEGGTDDWKMFVCDLRDELENHPKECKSLKVYKRRIDRLEIKNARDAFRDMRLNRTNEKGDVASNYADMLAKTYGFTDKDLE